MPVQEKTGSGGGTMGARDEGRSAAKAAPDNTISAADERRTLRIICKRPFRGRRSYNFKIKHRRADRQWARLY
jgi:hypothetical protein